MYSFPGERINDYFWAPDEPNNEFEQCLNLLPEKDFKWNDDNCGYIDRHYLCQYGNLDSVLLLNNGNGLYYKL